MCVCSVSSVIMQSLGHVRQTLSDGNTEIHPIVPLNVRRCKYNPRTAHVPWTKYELITRTLDEIRPYCVYCGINPTFRNDTGRYLLRDHIPPRVIKDHYTGWNNPLAVVLRKYQVLRSLKIRYETTIPSATLYIWNFTLEILYHLLSSIIWFDMFRDIYSQDTSHY